jgi:hypothetical protein
VVSECRSGCCITLGCVGFASDLWSCVDHSGGGGGGGGGSVGGSSFDDGV